MNQEMGPDERVFRAHLEAGPFQSGVERGKWSLISIAWPFVVFAVSAALRDDAPAEYLFRFNCANYPNDPPTSQPWDKDKKSMLSPNQWPGGGERIQKVFNPGWKNGECLYLPCDRISREGHGDWTSKHADLTWTSTSNITLYLEAIYVLLHSKDYKGIRST